VNLVVLVALVLGFAAFVTAHIALAARLCLRRPRWRGPLALFVPPLAPYWGAAERMTLTSITWIGSLVVYVVALIAATLTR
jgi:hypothetical protein